MTQRDISAESIAMLATYEWPGNIRELRNVVEKAVMRSERRRLEIEDFAAVLPALSDAGRQKSRPSCLLADAVADAERAAICATLAAVKGNKSLAAQQLGVSRATLYEKLTHLGMTAKDQRASG